MSGEGQSAAREAKAKGNEAFQAGRFAEAVEHFTAAIGHDASDHVFFSNRSACYASLEKYDEALVDGQECVRLKPEWPKGYARKGLAEYFLGKHDDAAETYKAGLKLAPEDAALKEGLRKAMDAKYGVPSSGSKQGAGAGGADSQVATALMIAAARQPKIREYMQDLELMKKFNMAVQMERSGMPDDLLSQVVQQDRRVLELFMAVQGIDVNNLQELLAAKGKGTGKGPAAALPKTEATAAAPAAPAAPAAGAKRPAPSETEHGGQTSAGPPPAKVAKVGKAAPKSEADAFKDQGNQLYKKRKFEEALSCYEKAIEAAPNDLTYQNNRCAVLIEMGEENYPKVLSICEDLVARRYEINTACPGGASFEKVAKVYCRMASVYEKQKRYDEAIAMYSKALMEDNSKNTRNALREVTAAKEKWEKDQYVDAAKAEEHREKGNEHFKSNRHAEAKAEYDEAIRRNPKDARLYSNRAATLTKLVAYPDALRDLDECLRLDPTFVKAYSRKGAAHFFMKEYHKALESYDKGLAMEKGNEECARGREQVMAKIIQSSRGGEVDEEQVRHAMADPEIQKMLHDPQIKLFLQHLQENPAEATKAMNKDPRLQDVVQKLVAAGIIRTR